MKFVVVAIAGFVLGGWAVPLGFVLDIGPIGTFVAAAGGGLIGCWAFLLAGDRVAEWAKQRRARNHPADDTDPTENADEEAEADSRVQRFVDRYGVRGLGIVGPIFPGVTVSVAGGLALGLDRRQLGKWMTIGIIAMYGLYVLGLSLLLALF
jgi:hypothetical protein